MNEVKVKIQPVQNRLNYNPINNKKKTKPILSTKTKHSSVFLSISIGKQSVLVRLKNKKLFQIHPIKQ